MMRPPLPEPLVFDGAMGTSLFADSDAPAAGRDDREPCHEQWNLTDPERIGGVHAAFLEAGADAIETNTFGASPLTLDEYGLAGRAREINRAGARIARERARDASAPGRPRFVFGSVGPGTRLPSLGQIGFLALRDAMAAQIEALAEGGVDGILFETCQDPLQIKAGLDAFDSLFGAHPAQRPFLYVSVTVEPSGALLIGTPVTAIAAILAPYAIDILGLNCATGPEAMRIHLDSLSSLWPGRIGCMPNAGLPVFERGRVRYPLAPEAFAASVSRLARDLSLHVVGGCCGTTPAHILALRRELDDWTPAPRPPTPPPEQAASLFAAVDLSQAPAPLFIGERANATGSKAFRDALLREDREAAFHLLSAQEETGAHALDLSCAFAGRDEVSDMIALVERAVREVRAPLVIDTTRPDVLEAALQRIGGRPLINSIHFEEGESRADRVARLARRFGAAVIGLTIDETGMAMSAERKVEIARRLASFCAGRGLRPGDLFIDPLTFTLGSGEATLRTAARETLKALEGIRAALPGVRTLLGISNISYGLKPAARRALNAVFLERALRAGLDACIVNTAALVPLADIPADVRAAADDLLDNRRDNGDPLTRFIARFESVPDPREEEAASARPPADRLSESVIRGRWPPADDALRELLAGRRAEDILDNILIPAMQEVGRLFNEGLLQLPFVLKSAEIMKQSVDRIRPRLTPRDGPDPGGRLVLATVAGDVHDIGKNLVDIILTNNGIRVVDLGTRVPVERMIEAVREHGATALGMSGLLVKSALLMAENLKTLAAAGLRIPVLLGGAALTPEFVEHSCAPHYGGPVRYCRDAFAGLSAMRELAETGGLSPVPAGRPVPPPEPSDPEAPVAVDVSAPPPAPPAWGARVHRRIPVSPLFALVREAAVVRGRWGYRRGALTAGAHEHILREVARPELERLQARCEADRLFEPQAAYGWFPCRARGNGLLVQRTDGGEIELAFPRQPHPPFRAVPDFFRPDRDVAGFFCVTLGNRPMEECGRLRRAGRYRDYLLLHGLAVETTDALAGWIHARMIEELRFPDGDPGAKTGRPGHLRGARFGFGYPSCPDLSLNRICCGLVGAETIGVRLTETDMMVPEVSTCALVAHHPRAKTFRIEEPRP